MIPLTPEAVAQANRRRPITLPPLACNGCRKCCIGDTVNLVPADDPAKYKTQRANGGIALAHDRHGNCVYLGKRGCQIQSTKPLACRAYDCRLVAWMTVHLPPEFQAGRIERASVQEGLGRLKELGVTP